jgi:hypothetical protein
MELKPQERRRFMGLFKRLTDRFTKPKSSVSLTISRSTIELGEDLKGEIVLSSQEEFDATEVRAELRCVERVKKQRLERRYRYNPRTRRRVRVEEMREYWDTATLHSADPRACEALHVTPGFKKAFPFKVNIPAGGRESYDSVDGGVTWFVKGVVAIDGRPDVTSETMELQVVKPTAGAVRREEVAMVPCEYCQTLMPQTASSCPICGAPRKA